jgi:hypothetical protein
LRSVDYVLPINFVEVSPVAFQMVLIFANPGKQFGLGESAFSLPRRKCGWRNALGRDLFAVTTRIKSIALDFTLLTENAWVLLRSGGMWGSRIG